MSVAMSEVNQDFMASEIEMKLLYTLPLLVALTLPSCATVETARDQLDTMSEAAYIELQQQVFDVARMGGAELADLLEDKPELLNDISELADELGTIIANDALDVVDVIDYLVDRFADDLDLKPEYQEYIRDGAKVIDAAVGQIRLGIDGTLTLREKDLLLSLLSGLTTGIGND